jgi:hypothetical protein
MRRSKSYWMPHVYFENSFKRKVPCLLTQQHLVSQAVRYALNVLKEVLRSIYNMYDF